MTLELAFSFVALGISVVTVIVVAVFARRPPPDSAELAEVKARLVALDQECVDVADRLSQWMRRESVRKMREGKEKAQAEATLPSTPADRKMALRQRAAQLRNQS